MKIKKPVLKSSFRVAILYALFGCLWILISDRILSIIVADPHKITVLQTYKGWAFVLASAVLLYIMVWRELKAREQSEQELKNSEEKYRTLIETANDAIFLADAETGTIIEANAKSAELLGIPREDIIGMHQSQLHPEDESQRCNEIFKEAIESRKSFTAELCVRHKDGHKIAVEISANTVEIDGKKCLQGIFRDISVQKVAEEALQRERDKAQQYLNVAGVILIVIDAHMKVSLINKRGCQILEYPEEEIIGRNWFDNFVPDRMRDEIKEVFGKLMAGKIEPVEYFENPVLTKSGEEKIIAWHNNILKDEQGSIIATLSSGEDITSRKKAEEQAEYRLKRLSALHTIDMVITSSLDLRVTLKEFLDQVIAQLQVDAADVLLLNPYTQTLEYAARRGFRNPAIQSYSLRIGDGIAGRAALERQSISISNMFEKKNDFKSLPFLEGEDFIAYTVIPLIAKGQVKGVLEIFHRSALEYNTEWFSFLEGLAAQAAIAIDNATLFDELQRTNIELTLAYDATLEGWAHALDLRSKETERHTARVTEMTLRLARDMGMSDKELMHIRRGALLHDIGKIGIPDSILLKPGPLTDEEWEIMRRHPVYAFEMLLPIAYLRPALDIPYCHHEKWDGTGYPRGLKEEQIPLPARIFAVVDMWDAMYSENRSYRQTWPAEKVREHIQSLAGTHFDPHVVEVFLKMEW